MKFSILFILFSFIMLSSCTVQKRRYSSGLHVTWRLNLKPTHQVKTKPSSIKEISKLKVRTRSNPSNYISNGTSDLLVKDTGSLTTVKTQKKAKATVLNSAAKHRLYGGSFKGLNNVANTIQKWKIVKRLSETQQITTPNKPVVQKEDGTSPTYRKGVLSFIFLILSFALSVIGFILAWNSGSLFALILIALALGLFVMAIIYGILAISNPKDKTDRAFGITTFAILTLLVLLTVL